VKECRLGSLVRGKEHPQESISPADVCAGSIDAITPVEIDVAVALALPVRK